METFEYTETRVSSQGFVRYASATLTRSEDRKYWETDSNLYSHRWIMDDFGFLVYVEMKLH